MYLDHAAATPMDPLVLQDMQPYFTENFFNPSSSYAPAVEIKRDYREAKSKIAKYLGVMTDELVMTAGATESINLAFEAAGEGKCLVGAIEHAAVMRAAEQYQTPVLIQPDEKGHITAEMVQEKLSPDVTFVSIALANHELGAVQPIEEISAVIRRERERRLMSGEKTSLIFHTDASQALALIDLKIKRLGVDLVTLSAAKIYGPKQVGLLWVRPGVKLTPKIVGGGQEGGLRSGTENVAGAIGFATAVELASRRRSGELKRLRNLRNIMASKLSEAFPEMVTSTDMKKSLVNYLNVSFPGVDAERLIFRLENQNVFVATGSACAANLGTRSHVLRAIGLSDAEIDGSLRLTLGRLNTEESIRKATKLIIQAVRAEQERAR